MLIKNKLLVIPAGSSGPVIFIIVDSARSLWSRTSFVVSNTGMVTFSKPVKLQFYLNN